MSACKFHPFEKLTDETSYFADSITVMTEEDKRKMYEKFAKTNLGQAGNQQKNKMDETRAIYSSAANAKKSFENAKTNLANTDAMLSNLEKQKTALEQSFGRLQAESQSKKNELNQQLMELLNGYKEAEATKNSLLTSAQQKYDTALNSINNDESVPPTVIEAQKEDLLNILNATTKNANSEFNSYKSSYEKNKQNVETQIQSINNETTSLKSKVDALNAKIQEQKKNKESLMGLVEQEKQNMITATEKRDQLTSQASSGQTGGNRGATFFENQIQNLETKFENNLKKIKALKNTLQRVLENYTQQSARFKNIKEEMKTLEYQNTQLMLQDPNSPMLVKMKQRSNQLKAELATVVNVMKKLENERDTLTLNMNGFVLSNNTITNEIEKLKFEMIQQDNKTRIDSYIPREPWRQSGGVSDYGLPLHEDVPIMYENKQRYTICPHSISNNSLTSHTLKNINNSPMFNMFSTQSKFATGYSGLRTVGPILSQRK